MVKHTQTISPLIADELFVFDNFVGLVLKELEKSTAKVASQGTQHFSFARHIRSYFMKDTVKLSLTLLDTFSMEEPPEKMLLFTK